jgi:hypothetical protein
VKGVNTLDVSYGKIKRKIRGGSLHTYRKPVESLPRNQPKQVSNKNFGAPINFVGKEVFLSLRAKRDQAAVR